MRKAVIISDIHLAGKDGQVPRLFELFLKRVPDGARLIIAGDLFDFYVGFNPRDPASSALALLLRPLASRGISCEFMTGNRDFLMGRRDAAFFSMSLLSEYTVLNARRGSALLIHGDELCSNDKSFQRFRALGRNRLARFLFLSLPYSIRTRIGLAIRSKSMKADPMRDSAPERFGLVGDSAIALMRRYGVETIIHGHFHRFSDTRNSLFKGSRMLCLGCWGSKFSYAVFDENGARAYEFAASLLEDPKSELPDLNAPAK
jgi:UDP-2,3-diacylglucosamine hydrolase